MTEPFIGEIRAFGFNFAPRGWALCNGQLIPIQQNTALFSLLGTQYGGNGTTTFALPNLQDRLATSQGNGPGLSPWSVGQTGGAATVTLLQTEMASHNHALQAFNANATVPNPANASIARGRFTDGGSGGSIALYQTAAPNVAMSPQAMALSGGNQPHNNIMPSLVMNFCIALQGIFPPRN